MGTDHERIGYNTGTGNGTGYQRGYEGIDRIGRKRNTLVAYRRATRSLGTWLSGRVLSGALLAEYITELHAEGKWQVKHQGADIDLSLPLSTRTFAGIRREGKDRGRGQVEGIVWSDVDRVVAFCDADKTIAGLRDACLIRLMSDCLLRVGEAVAVNVGDFKKNTLLIRESKTDQQGTGESLYVCQSTRRLLKRYMTRAEIKRGALFRQIRRGDHVQKGRLTQQSARRIIKRRAKQAGVEGFISGHSFRVGSAISLAQAGAIARFREGKRRQEIRL